MVKNVATTGELTYWEGVSRTRWGRYLTEIERRTMISAIEMSAGFGTVLDIGCDCGRWSSLFMDQRWKIICTDVRREALEEVQRRLPRTECIFVRKTDTSLPCAAKTLDFVLCMEVDSVISSEWFIEEASRVLKAGGILVATLNNKSSLRAVFHQVLRPDEAVMRKEKGFYEASYRDCRTRLLRCGFQIIHEEGCCWPP